MSYKKLVLRGALCWDLSQEILTEGAVHVREASDVRTAVDIDGARFVWRLK